MRTIFQKKGKKGQNIWKYGQKCTKFENTLKKSRRLRTIIARNKLLEKALVLPWHLQLTAFGNFLNHSTSLVSFYNTWKYQKTCFMLFSRYTERIQCIGMDWIIRSHTIIQNFYPSKTQVHIFLPLFGTCFKNFYGGLL